MKDSAKTQPLFDKSVEVIQAILDEGRLDLDQKGLVDVAMRAFVGHIKVKNTEIKESTLKYAINKDLHSNIEGLKETLQQQLPEFAGEGK